MHLVVYSFGCVTQTYELNLLKFELPCWSQVREKEEDAKILEYTRAKEAREAELAAEKERIAREKEMETARLRAMQVSEISTWHNVCM
jgi:hypothetical protein